MIVIVNTFCGPSFEAWDPGDGEPVRPLDTLDDDDAAEICTEILGVVGLDGLPGDRQWQGLSPGQLVRACQDFVEFVAAGGLVCH